MEKIRFKKMVPGWRVFFVLLFLCFCLPLTTYAQNMPGTGERLAAVFSNGFIKVLVIAALVFVNYLVFLSRKEPQRKQKY
ncbi:hypothetical protein [Mucilaginibacter pedocola]|nr:hypothetical protein [Mucilaginibacter pedocola]